MAGNMRHLLLVEDDKTIAMGLEYTLRQEGYDVTCCYTAASAREALASTRVDIALLDPRCRTAAVTTCAAPYARRAICLWCF